MSERDDTETTRTVIVTYRAPLALATALDRVAAAEGITRSDVARRAAMRDLQRSGLFPAVEASAEAARRQQTEAA